MNVVSATGRSCCGYGCAPRTFGTWWCCARTCCGRRCSTRLAELSAAASVTVWLVWHHRDPPPSRWPNQLWPGWADAAAVICGDRPPANTSGSERDGLDYRDVLGRARREARLWRIDPPRQRRFTEPGCALGAVLQRLTIDAVTSAEVQTCLRAIHTGFAAEGLVLTVPTDPAAVAALGPRLTPDILDRLRRLACPNIGRAAAHARIPAPPAATSARSDRGPDGPFAADFTRYASLTATEPNRTAKVRPLAAVA